MEFCAYRFLGESMAAYQDGNGGMVEGVFMPEYGTEMVASFILKLFSAGSAFVSLHSAI